MRLLDEDINASQIRTEDPDTDNILKGVKA